MEVHIEKLLFSLLRRAFSQSGERWETPVDPELLEPLLELAQKHDIAHLVAMGLQKTEADPNLKVKAQPSIFGAVYRYEQINYALEKTCRALEQAGIPFIPLKGSVLRAYYPEPWMRTSCDIDILVQAQDLNRAVACLESKLRYTEQRKTSHDVSLFSPEGIHIELHYSLVEEGLANDAAKILANVWDTALQKQGYTYRHEMPDDIFYFYHVAHMAKHFENGGCGIRPFIDLWLLDKLPQANMSKRELLLEKGKLLQFAQAASRLSGVWLEAFPSDACSTRMQSYILYGGVYGNSENRVLLQQQKKGGKVGYILSKVVLPYDDMLYRYNILDKHRWLMPFLQVHRWGRMLFGKGRHRLAGELALGQGVSQSQAEEMHVLLKEVGLL